MKIFRSDVNNPKILILLGMSFALLTGIVVFDHMGTDRFPSFYDISIASLVPICIYAILWLVAYLMPITVNENSIKCYNIRGIYKVLQWSDISDVYLKKVFGLPYAFIDAKHLSSPITVPLYLTKMQDFVGYVREQAGAENKFSVFLENGTQQAH